MMSTIKISLMVILFFITGLAYAQEQVSLARIALEDESSATIARRGITIVDAGSGWVHALVSGQERQSLETAGYVVEILIPDYQAYKDAIFTRGFYHTYEQVYAALDSFAVTYPSLCRLDTIGYSVQNRPIWAMRVTDYPDSEECEPEIRLAGNIHGDEHIGTEITLYFLRFILEDYGSNAIVQDLVDEHELWILPTINPDGKVANTRRNANNVDLNRDCGYFWDAWGGSPGPLSQIENKVMRTHLLENNVSLEYNYHSAAQYVNYPWDYHYSDPPDSELIIALSDIYEDSTGLTAINGYDWYQVTGSLQDYTTGTSGAFAWTIETLEPPSSGQIDEICWENRDALLEVCRRAGWGMQGTVRDSVTGEPLLARIEFIEPQRIDVYTDPGLGDFHKMCEAGTYDIRVTANGYGPVWVLDVNVPATGSIDIGDVLLSDDSTYRYAFGVVLCRYAAHAEQNNSTQPRYALGAPDDVFFSLGQNGYVVLDMGEGTPVIDSTGDDYTVFEGDDGADEGYTVSVSNAWDGPWIPCGSATGTASFDLATTGLASARYVRVTDDGSSSSGSYAGFDLDAIQALPVGSGIAAGTTADPSPVTKRLSVRPNPLVVQSSICYHLAAPAEVELSVYDVTGSLVTVLADGLHEPGMHTVIWRARDAQDHAVTPGIYFIRLSVRGRDIVHDRMEKIIII